jgi:O-acetyl-ADP-ribose deacetylase (regulator of RNase III)
MDVEGGRIRITRDDITRLPVDAVVNAANSSLANGGGVAGAIYRGAGPELGRACAALGGCPAGEARITPGFRLPARWIIHAVGPIWRGGGSGEEAALRSAYRSAYRLAREHRVRSIALPALSCGIFGFPAERAAPIALAEARRAVRENPLLEQVVLACPDLAVHAAYLRAETAVRGAGEDRGEVSRHSGEWAEQADGGGRGD